MNFMSSLVVTMETHYHGVFVRTLNPSGRTWSVVRIYGQVINPLLLGGSYLLNLCKQF